MRPSLIAGNWKMNGLTADAGDLARAMRSKLEGTNGAEVLICPPFLSLQAVGEALNGSSIRLGAQDMHWESKGAFTGETSPAMLREVGCTHVILGHSERRHIMGENNEMINKKVRKALESDLTPILCVGELLEERNMGVTHEVVERQINKGLEGLSGADIARMILAYEPVWAIGTGQVATPRQAQDVHHYLRKLVSKLGGADVAAGMRILYGGSVKPENIKDLMAEEDIDGALVGGASLKADSFAEIVRHQK